MRVYRIRSKITAKKLTKELDRLDAIAIATDSVESREEIELAYHLAESAVTKGKNIGKQLRYEFLLWLAGKRDIKSAIEATTPNGGEFFVVVFSSEGIGCLNAKELELGLKNDGEPLRLERISLSRVKN